LNDQADESVVRACRGDEKAVYVILVQRHYRHVFALCLGMLANVHDAEDVAQETMLRGFVSLRKLAKPQQFESWILRIARNLCIDLLRWRKRTRVLPVESEPISAPKAQDNHDLEAAIARLPQELRVPLTLFYFEHKDAGSIAKRLNISPSLVYERIRTARKELHALLTEKGCP